MFGDFVMWRASDGSGSLAGSAELQVTHHYCTRESIEASGNAQDITLGCTSKFVVCAAQSGGLFQLEE